jgi:GNAT superfamily N-acetyltransferase
MAQTLSLRRSTMADIAAVDRLLQNSYPALLRPDYPPSVMVLALPIITRARPELLGSGRYFVVEDEEGRLLGGGGWSVGSPTDHSDSAGMGHIRHVATDRDHLRRGIGRMVMERIFRDAEAEGTRWLNCLSTRTAVPFYAALGFRAVFPVDVTLRPGISFPAIRMLCDLQQRR